VTAATDDCERKREDSRTNGWAVMGSTGWKTVLLYGEERKWKKELIQSQPFWIFL
jgi:hypothetical protein